MRPLERVPAVRRIGTDHTGVFAFEITGDFNAADAENLCGLLEGAYAIKDRVDLLVRVEALDSIDMSELSTETTTFMRDHLANHVGRLAIIDDGGWASEITSLLSVGGTVETRHFALKDEGEAWAWIGAREVEENI